MSDELGRPNQRRRTRKDLMAAANRLMKQGRKPSLEEVAEEAMVSRATAYRYFASVEALLNEAALEMAAPDAESVFGDEPGADPVARLDRVDAAFQDMMSANEAGVRLMLAQSVQHRIGGERESVRQNRRLPLIEAALAPARKEFRPGDLDKLQKALALVIGTEGMVVFKDVLQLDEAEAQKVRRWAIRALVNAARK
ncbi:MAG: TetR/AcrR family transcriptional regulator [Hyphomonadaceae bacterium]|nr:TetR/AcrR family transcriptional regulator [Hyphomonadaceae bacterium]